MRQNKQLVIAIAAVMFLVIGSAIIWPLTERRSAAIDDAIESDFSDIAILVEKYYQEELRLPDELLDVDLSKDQKNRADKFDYELDKKTSSEYEICAEFKTDTSKELTGPANPYELLSSPSYGLNPAEKHAAGIDCIEYQVYGINYRTGFNGGANESIFDGQDGFTEPAEAESQVFEL